MFISTSRFLFNLIVHKKKSGLDFAEATCGGITFDAECYTDESITMGNGMIRMTHWVAWQRSGSTSVTPSAITVT